jgi:hypothetical protein
VPFGAHGEWQVSEMQAYGFEMVDAARTGRVPPQSKIYDPDESMAFLQTFDELSPTQSLAIYPGLLVER